LSKRIFLVFGVVQLIYFFSHFGWCIHYWHFSSNVHWNKWQRNFMKFDYNTWTLWTFQAT
jgi:hypothetical protein